MRDGLYFRVKRLGFGRQMVIMPFTHSLSSRVPYTITDGARADYLMPWSEYETVNRDAIREDFGGRFGWLNARLFRIGVSTSAGGEFYTRIEKTLAKRFLEVAARPSDADSA
jgi:hypothetical protein